MYIHLGEQWERHSVRLPHKPYNVLFTPWLLLAELVTGESQHSEAAGAILCLESHQLSVVHVCVPTLAGNVYNQGYLTKQRCIICRL